MSESDPAPDLIQRATVFATQAHGRIEHRRKYTGKPYDSHLVAVARIVETVTDDPEVIAAAWLHDVVEDTPATFGDVEREFGLGVAQLVADLTDVSRRSDGNRAVRRAIDRAHLAEAAPRAQTVKLADLIDNCTDICKHDRDFGRVFVVEMAALLDVLDRGDPALMRRARKVLEKSAKTLDVPLLPALSRLTAEAPSPQSSPQPYSSPGTPPPMMHGDALHAWRPFAKVFATRDVARPLRCFDGERSASDVAERMAALGLDVIGVDTDGETRAFARLEDVSRNATGAKGEADGGTLAERALPIHPRQRIDAEASLTEMVRLLTRHDHGFVTVLGGVNGMVTRNDVQKPVVRMWLFGMITLVELTLTERVRKRWPDDSFVSELTATRRDLAVSLREERARRGQTCELLDCLQLGDKAALLIQDPEELRFLGFESRKSAKAVIQQFQSLRNNLAHAQDIVTHDWPQIARLTARVERLVAGD